MFHIINIFQDKYSQKNLNGILSGLYRSLIVGDSFHFIVQIPKKTKSRAAVKKETMVFFLFYNFLHLVIVYIAITNCRRMTRRFLFRVLCELLYSAERVSFFIVSKKEQDP